MPTYDWTARFRREFESLTPEQQTRFLRAVRHFVDDLRAGTVRAGLRVKPFRGSAGLFEFTWAPDGRALFRYGTPLRSNDRHIIWERIGGHEIFENP